MRSHTVRSGLRLIWGGIIAVCLSTFFPGQLADLFTLGMAAELRLTMLGFMLGGVLGGCGVLIAAAGFWQSGSRESQVPLYPSFLLIILTVALFFYLAFHSLTSPRPPALPPGESITI